ncbi:MAG: TolC family protein, partial [Lewinella sp.]|nr:TolC family protein [Lewinella sp.]
IRLEVGNARLAYENARQRLADRDDNLALAQRIYDTTQTKYREGVGSSLEVSQAEQSLYTAQSNRLQALYDLLTAKIDLEAALGLR